MLLVVEEVLLYMYIHCSIERAVIVLENNGDRTV